jgi:Mn2+/Fe2+ NRAMP family transporter
MPTTLRVIRRFAQRPFGRSLFRRLPAIALLAAIGPGLVSGFADNDAGGITTYSSAILAHPDWGKAATYAVVPHFKIGAAYLLAVVGTIGTTITPWGQAFIQSYSADKRLTVDDLVASRIDITAGTLITNVVAGFIVIACAATLFANGESNIPDAATAAKALGPLAGRGATALFAFGLLAASLIGLGTVPLTSAYAASEAFGFERGLDWGWREAPVFYGMLAFFIGFSALFIVIPGLPLIQVLFLSQVFDGMLLPIILVFVMIMSADRRMLGSLVSGRVLQVHGWLVVVSTSALSIALVVTTIAAR